MFDPLKYMNISDGQKRVVATDYVPSLYLYSVSSVLVVASKMPVRVCKVKNRLNASGSCKTSLLTLFPENFECFFVLDK